MSQSENNLPVQRVVKFYGEGRNASSAEVGALWENKKGGFTIILNFPDRQEKFSTFPIEHKSNEETA